MLSIIDYTTQWKHSFLFAYQSQFCRVTSVSHWQQMIISLIVGSRSLVSLLITHASFSTSLPSCVYLYTPFLLPSMYFSWGFAHHHGTLSRADSIIDILCTDALVPLVHSSHRSGRGLPACPPGVLLLLQGGVWRSGDGATTGAGRHPQCSFTPGSLGWLEMKERWEGG